jgi:hypothetical protein
MRVRSNEREREREKKKRREERGEGQGGGRECKRRNERRARGYCEIYSSSSFGLVSSWSEESV